MSKTNQHIVTAEMIEQYYECNRQKKELEQQMESLKKKFNDYLDTHFGENVKGELKMGGYKLQRQVRNAEKFLEEPTVTKLESLNMNELIKVIKKPDDAKIKAAIELKLLDPLQLEGCLVSTSSTAISVRPLTPR
jgi:hypothetical protein